MIIIHSFPFRVSSTYGRDIKSYGKQYLIDGSDETCWNSDSGDIQWIDLKFSDSVSVAFIQLLFQGGFVGKEVIVFCDGAEVARIYPTDTNNVQQFELDGRVTSRLKLLFNGSTDMFGRIVVYNVDIFSRK